jgi:hypothetical protein
MHIEVLQIISIHEQQIGLCLIKENILINLKHGPSRNQSVSTCGTMAVCVVIANRMRSEKPVSLNGK